jgi:hypothetical protein
MKRVCDVALSVGVELSRYANSSACAMGMDSEKNSAIVNFNARIVPPVGSRYLFYHCRF